MIGHTKAAAGSAGLIKAALALYHKVLPPTLKADPVDANLGLEQSRFFLPGAPRPWIGSDRHPRRAGVSAFGFGGSNFHAVLEEAGSEKPVPAWHGSCQILAFSGRDPAAVRRKVAAFCDRLAEHPTREALLAHEASRLRSRFSASDPWRLTALLDPEKDVPGRIEQLRSAAFRMAEDTAFSPSSADAIYSGGPVSAGGLAVLFPGQGSQYPDMGLELVLTFPEAFKVVERFCSKGPEAFFLSERIYPFAPDEGSAARLRPTDVAQPAIGAVSLAMWRVLERFGVSPSAFAGHSFGELTALCAAGRMEEGRFAELAWTRGRLMAEAGAGRDPGVMLAVRAPLLEIEKLAAQGSPDLLLANRNAPDQGVLAGTEAAVSEAERRCRQNGWQTVRLPVAAAFHTPLVARAAVPFSSAVGRMDPVPESVPVYSNTTAAPYPEDPEEAGRLLGRQLARPVDFAGQVEALHRAGCRVFLEVGPGRVLSGLARATLSGKPAAVFSMDDPTGRGRSGIVDLARTLCRLSALGLPVDLAQWEPAEKAPRSPKMEIMLSGANLRPPDLPAAEPALPKEPGTPPLPLSPEKEITPRSEPEPRPMPDPTVAVRGVDHPQQTPTVNMTMKSFQTETPKRPSALADAFRVVEEGIRSMQALQEQTARAHEKFLEIQAEAARNLQRLIEGTRNRIDSPSDRQAAGAQPIPTPAPWASEDKMVPAAAGAPVENPPPVSHPAEGDPEPPQEAVSTAEPPENASSEIKETLLAVVAELTGYPVEMIGPDMDIEADLGIDSIKRVEILATMEEKMPGLPPVTPEMMGTLRTLNQITAFLSSGLGEDGSTGTDAYKEPDHPPTEAPSPEPLPAETPSAAPLLRRTVAMVERPRGKKELPGLAEGRRIYVTEDGSGLSSAIVASLSAAGLAARQVPLTDSPPDFSDAAGLVIVAPPGMNDAAALKRSLAAASAAGRALEASAAGGFALFAAVVRLDGAFGFGPAKGRFDPTAGGLSGLVKCAAIEWPAVTCRVLDVDPTWSDTEAIAAEVTAELFSPGQEVEVGLCEDRRRVPELRDAPFAADAPEIPDFSPEDVVIVTGGARGVTAEAAVELARSARPTLVLLGRSPAPEPEPAWLQGVEGEAGIKKALLAQAFSGRRPSPAELETAYRRVASAREIAGNLARMEQAGSRVRYFTGDVRDVSMLDSILEEVRTFYGPVTAVVHGAGVLEDRLIVDKTAEQFDRVFSTKVTGLISVLEATRKDPVRSIVLFSSVAARFGNRGQADYAMANEVLNKIAQVESASRPGCRVVAINWGPWDGGMVSPALKREFERRGIGLISPDAGAQRMLREMAASPDDPVEVVTGPSLSENQQAHVPDGAGQLSLTLRRELDVEGFPVLASHMLDGKPVVPFALMADWLGHGALKENPGLRLVGLDDIRVLKGIRIEAEKRLVRLMAGKAVKEGALFLADVEIRDGVHEGREVVHYRAKAVLSQGPLDADAPEGGIPCFADETAYHRSAEEIYRETLFHGIHLQGIRRIIGFSSQGMRAELSPAPEPQRWMVEPPFDRWVLDPLVLDSAFQMSIVWSVEQFGHPCLPSYAASYRQYRERFPENGVVAVMAVTECARSRMKGDFYFLDTEGGLIARLSGYEGVMDPGLTRSFQQEGAVARVNSANG
ncbi:MAG: SDR family NAD(P)-dependent oxidoreductase, partial [Desulfobacterales bacterium]|jgi:acyl transferase domain-containing protein/NAD(P)-dependent dehydrogenase (short-subunit alcohol dehydrogenase family)